MKIWYQSYGATQSDPTRRKYRDDLAEYVKKVARPDTKVDLHGVEKDIGANKMTVSDYLQYMHVAQIIDKALQAEREGYDAFCLGGTMDPGHIYLREVLDIPVAFIGESSFYHACLLARKFGILAVNERMLRRQMDLAKFYGLEQRCAPGVHLDSNLLEIIELSEKEPKRLMDKITKAGRELIAAGAGAIIPGFGAVGAFLGQQNFHAVDGVPIVDITATVIKTAEMLVDMQRLGVKRSRAGSYNYVSKDELIAARKFYGVE